jgi:redox-sensitive bicupin YhaK (pirin superfamily)
MITLRRALDRGHFDHGWLDTSHTFSFADYHDPDHMGFRALRVINEDRVAPGEGFGTHGHRDMEILSYVLEGGLEHGDSMGNGSVIRPGDVQRMSAGTGVRHSERNASAEEAVHFLQIWLLPSADGLPPGYEQKAFDLEAPRGRLHLVASPDGRDGSLTVHADAAVYAGRFEAGARGELALAPGRHAWVQLARGRARVNGHELAAGDGAALSEVAKVELEGLEASEVLVFDLG